MFSAVSDDIKHLRTLKAAALKLKYEELFGEPTRSLNRQFLFRRVAWRMQALAQGDLSERARRRAFEIANDADWKVRPSRNFSGFLIDLPKRDRRLPPPGSTLTRVYRGCSIVVKVLEDGFEWEQRHFGSLSKVASAITNTRWNGFAFFALAKPEDR